MHALGNKLAALALTACLAMSLTAHAGETATNASGHSGIKVSFDDLDFNDSAAVADLYRRIQQSARLACTDSASPWDARRQRNFERCHDAAVAAD